jgi:hypothetical protein
MASNTKVAVAEAPSVVSFDRTLLSSQPDFRSDPLSQVPSAKTSPMRVVITGLPADHSLSPCMGEYVEQTDSQDDRPTFVGGCCNDMMLCFSNILGWKIHAKRDELAVFLYSKAPRYYPTLQ